MSTPTHTNVLDELADLVENTDPKMRPLNKQSILIFGHPGTGKTNIAKDCPNHFYIDLEASATSHAVRGLKIKSWAQFEKLVDYVHKGGSLEAVAEKAGSPGPVETLIIDTVTDLWRLCREHVLAEKGIKTEPENDYGKTLNHIRDLFMRYMNRLLVLNAQGELGLILIAHEEVEEIKEPTRTLHVFWPMVPDRKVIRPYIAGKPQIVMRTIKTATNPLTGEPLGEVRWLVQALPTDDKAIIKDRTGRLPGFMNASWEAIQSQYDKGRAEG